MLAKSMLPGSSLQAPKSFLWLETAEGFQEEVEQEVVVSCPFIWREAFQKGKGASRKTAILLPPQVTPTVLPSILEYCRFHQLPGRSNKERKFFDERFVRRDTKKLCELTSAADSLQMKALVDLTSRALARLIEGKNPEEIRETFNLPDDLTEEEKLEPLNNTSDDPRIRLLNRLYARKRKGLKDKQKLKSIGQEEDLQDERSLEDLLSFINGVEEGHKHSNKGKSKKKRNRRKKDHLKSPEMSSLSKGNMISCGDIRMQEASRRVRLASEGNSQKSGVSMNESFAFEVGFEVDDGLDPSMEEELDREVEDFARRLNSDWPERRRMHEYPADGQMASGHLPSRIASISLSESWSRGKDSKTRSKVS